MTITPATDATALQQRRPPTYFPGNDEDPRDAPPAPSAEFSFSDLLDVINPLQHIPIVSSIYRAITGDTISPTANVMGSALFGGPMGALAAAATEMFSEITGGSPEEHLVAMVEGEPVGGVEGEPEAAPAERPALVAAAVVPAPSAAAAAADVRMAPVAAPVLAEADGGASAEAPPAEIAPTPTPLFQALQAPAGTTVSKSLQGSGERTGRDIRSYFAESVHVRREQAPTATAREASPSTEGTAAGMAKTPEMQEREAMRAAVAAAHARGIEMLRQQGQVQGDSAPQNVPDWFAERMMQGLSRYREGSQLGTAQTPGVAAAG